MILPANEGDFELTEDLINGLKTVYSSVDVLTELYKINLWLHKNPARRPKLMLRFIEKWLSKVKPKEVKLHIVNGKMTEQELLEFGKQKGMEPRAGESWAKFAERVRNAA